MEENNKYYTPEIEEFHVGFEYEYINNKTKTWTKDVFNLIDADFMEMMIDHEACRIKHLDQSDIEELGWKYKGKSIDIWFEKEGTFDMESWTAYKIIMHYGLHDKRMHIYADDSGERYSIFRGVIKNKSELQRLMKQLGII